MKTLKFTTAIMMIFFFAGLTSAYSTTRNDGKGSKPAGVVRYQVNVHINSDIDLCNAYLVVLVDGHGNPVAPSLGYVPGVNTYTFTEAASTASVRGVRMIENSAILHFICVNELSTAPVFHMGPFMTGQTYTFELFPMTKSQPMPKTSEAPKE